MQVQLRWVPALLLTPSTHTPTGLAFWVSATRRVTRNWFAPYPGHINHPFIISQGEGWRLAKINSSKKKKKTMRSDTHFSVSAVVCLHVRPLLKLLLSYKLTYTSAIRLSETIRRDGGGWRLAWSCGWKADGVLTDEVVTMTAFISTLNTMMLHCQGNLCRHLVNDLCITIWCYIWGVHLQKLMNPFSFICLNHVLFSIIVQSSKYLKIILFSWMVFHFIVHSREYQSDWLISLF